MNQQDLINKVKSAIPYYIEATSNTDRAFYEDSLRAHLTKFFKNAFNHSVEFVFEVRKNQNFQLSDVCVLGLLQSRRAEGRVWYDLSTKIPKRYLISFGPEAYQKTAEELCALLLYGILSYTVTEFNTRISRCILEITKANDLVYDSKELNQLAGVLYYLFGLKNTYYVPVKDFSTNSLLDMFFSLSPELYNEYAKFSKKQLMFGQGLDISEGRRTTTSGEDRKYFYLPDAEKVNEQIIKNTIKEDISTAKTIYNFAISGQLDRYLEEVHEATGIQTKLKDLLSFQMLDKSLKSSNFVKKYVDDITESVSVVNEGIFGPNTEAEYTYKYNKILVNSDYIESENDRTSVLVDAFRLKTRVQKEIDKETARMEGAINKNIEKKASDRIDFLNNLYRQLSEIENKVVKFKIGPKKFGVFVEYPAGYEY